MGKRLYVGNIPYNTDDAALTAAFQQDGRTVAKVHIVTDRETGRPRGFAFVEMSTDEEAAAAITSMDGFDMGGRSLKVNEAEERQPRGGAPGRGAPPGRGGSSGYSGSSGNSGSAGRGGFHGRGASPGGPPSRGADARRGGGRNEKKGRGSGRGQDRDGDTGGRGWRGGSVFEDEPDFD